MEYMRNSFKTHIKQLKNNQSVMRNAVTEIGNKFDALNRKLKEAAKQTSDIEEKILENK